MKIAIIGTGAMGSVYAGVLAEAGHEIWAIDSWADHIEQIKSNGLTLKEPVATAPLPTCLPQQMPMMQRPVIYTLLPQKLTGWGLRHRRWRGICVTASF